MEEGIDTGRPPPVQSLRSRFEQLSVSKSIRSHYRHSSGSHGDSLAPSSPGSPRPRATSNTIPNAQSDTQSLRSSSSSSDLKGTKRPPPPPPSRPPIGLSGSPTITSLPSPLLRPVPIPPGAVVSPRINPTALPTNSPSGLELSGSFSRRKLSTSPGKGSTYPSDATTTASTNVSSRPPIPPRPPRSDTGFLQLPQAHSPEDLSDSSSGSLRNLSPFSEYEDAETPTAPPALPVRKHRHHHPHPRHGSGAHSSESGMTTIESDLNFSSPKPSLPPPPPPRLRRPISPGLFDSSSASASSPSLPSLITPPPLPVRRSTVAQLEEISPGPPRLPVRPLAISSHISPESPGPSPTSDRRTFGSSRLPPPPTRIIGLGDKLPPPRRPPSPSSEEESGEEDSSGLHLADSLPDRSRSSRRPPILLFRDGSEPNIHVHAFTGIASVAGTTAVVAHNHHVKIYDLAQSDVPVHNIDSKDIAHKEVKITSMEFRPCARKSDRGFLLWLGTKEGHIFEMDARTGGVVGSKHSAHLHAITHIFRHGRNMVTLDDSGKGLVFSPDASGEDISLANTQPRVVRFAEKQDFVKIIGGKLWTAARWEQQISMGVHKTPIVRVYDIFGPGNATKAVLPAEPIGVVMSATIVPSMPEFVYMGHEGGYVSIWVLEGGDGYPKFLEAMKISTSDIVSLEGVNDRLWAGGRSGMISAFDVSQKPWIVTNCWSAHPGLPVLKLAVDHYGIDKIGRLCVVSIGRDEQLRLWDGLLGLDWVDHELSKQEHSFSTSRDLKVLLISWNCDAARPENLTGDPANVSFLTDVLQSVDSPDIISFGFQEVIDLESRKMAAKNVFLSSKKKSEDGGLSEKVTSAYRRWYDRMVIAIRQAMPPEETYSVIHTENLVGLFTCIFVKNSERPNVKEESITTIKRGMGGRYGNKGGIVSRFVIEDSSLCLINCHLAAGQAAVRQRNADVAGMLEEKAVFPETHYPFAYVGGGDGTMVLDHEIVFVNGDMNYRIDHRRDAIVAAVRAKDLNSLLPHDQLLREIKFNRACRFRGFSEGPLTFAPTYKYDRRSDEYDSSEKHRSPAWCDRVLWRSRVPTRVTQLHYQRYEANVSDHRPISAAFSVTVKSIKHEARLQVKAVVQAGWVDEQSRLLAAAKQFYVEQALI